MTPTEYMKLAEVTDSDLKHYEISGERLKELAKVMHYGIGLSTEANEILDALKKHFQYGKPLDTVNIKEEISDCLWFISGLLRHYNWTFEEVMETNINKLKARYGTKFSEAAALNRDLESERKILEL